MLIEIEDELIKRLEKTFQNKLSQAFITGFVNEVVNQFIGKIEIKS